MFVSPFLLALGRFTHHKALRHRVLPVLLSYCDRRLKMTNMRRNSSGLAAGYRWQILLSPSQVKIALGIASHRVVQKPLQKSVLQNNVDAYEARLFSTLRSRKQRMLSIIIIRIVGANQMSVLNAEGWTSGAMSRGFSTEILGR